MLETGTAFRIQGSERGFETGEARLSQGYRVSGDDGVGTHRPQRTEPADFPRLPELLLSSLRRLPGASPTASDVLDELGLALAVSADVLPARWVSGVVAGQVLTARYLPERRAFSDTERRRSPSRFAHHTVFSLARPGDVVVIDAHGIPGLSVVGGIAAHAARSAGIAGVVVDGAVRDLVEIRALGLPIWSRSLTPRTGKWRLEAVAINEPVMCGGVQVRPGDLMVGDESGICFIPVEVAERAVARVLEVEAAEEGQLSGR
jgi:4-hydroxy-4-methyl-2-oxoglutarate aldolase